MVEDHVARPVTFAMNTRENAPLETVGRFPLPVGGDGVTEIDVTTGRR
jgi:hypothetical protein